MKNISYWLDSPYMARPALERDIETDVVVIGGGIAGISAAYHATELGFKTVLIEQNEIASGPGGKNGGMIVEGLAIDFQEAVKRFGSDEACELWNATVEATALTKSLIKANQIDCDYTEEGSVYVSTNHDEDMALKKELEARDRYGMSGRCIEHGEQFKNSPFGLSVYNPKDAGIHPVKFLRALAAKAEEKGLLIFEHTRALAWDEHAVHSPKGKIHTRHVIQAIESAIDDKSCEIMDSTGIMTHPVSKEVFQKMDWKTGEMLWTTGSNYLCVRRYGDRFFINSDSPEKALNDFFSYFPSLTRSDIEISHVWHGKIMYPKDDRPKILFKDGIHMIFGQGGNGLTNGIITGKIISEHLKGKPIPDIYRVLK